MSEILFQHKSFNIKIISEISNFFFHTKSSKSGVFSHLEHILFGNSHVSST